jgi:predicted MPP superfamily phosphohydrolase
MFDAHYEAIGFVLFAACFAAPAVPACCLLPAWLRAWREPARRKRAARRLLAALAAGAVVYLGVFAWGGLVEPNWPELGREAVEAPFDPPLRLLHLSDLHLEPELAAREQWMLRQAAELKPDLIVITGDIHQLDNFDAVSIGKVLSQITAPLGVYGCVGFDNVRVLREAAPQLRMLENESVTLRHGGKTIALAGLSRAGQRDKVYEGLKDADYRIILHHTPDLAEEASQHGADLYLCGHTHGGQVRVPFWGAVITLAETGKRYEAGRHRVGRTTVYTSRGLGLEPRPAPQVRFLCRPELTLFTVGAAP